MDNDLLIKYKNDPNWAEVIRLYSGLFDTQDEREDFIINLAETDILLAAECKTSSMEKQEHLQQHLSDKATSLLNNVSSSFSEADYLPVFFSLNELNRLDIISNYLTKIKHKDIPLVRNLLKKLPLTIEAKNVLLAAVYSQPSFFIYTLLEIIEELEKEQIYLTNEDINKVFETLIIKKVKSIHIFAYLKKFASKIQNINSYREDALKLIYDVTGFYNLKNWISLFSIKLSSEKLIEIFCDSESIKALHNVIFLLKEVKTENQIPIIKKMLNSNSKVITTAIIYSNSINNLRKLFQDQIYQQYQVKRIHDPIDKYSDFSLVFHKVHKKVLEGSVTTKEINSLLRVGDILNFKLISKRLKYYLVHNLESTIVNTLTYIIPLQEATGITESNVHNKQNIKAKIIHIDISKRKVFLSMKQINKNTDELIFKEEYLTELNIGDKVLCTLGQRFQDKVLVRIYGMNKSQKAIILGDTKVFEGTSKVFAKVINIKDETVYLNLESLIKNETNTVPSNKFSYTSLTELRDNNKIGVVQKLLILLNERFIHDVEFSFMDFQSKISFIPKRTINSLFPSKLWFINYLEDNGYVSKTNTKGTYKFIKSLNLESFDEINNELKLQGWSTLSSFNDNKITTASSDKLNMPLKISINDIVEATITNITLFGLSLKIERLNKQANIFINELSDRPINNMNEVTYNGKKLHIGQKVSAKIITIDEKKGISLTLKGIK